MNRKWNLPEEDKWKGHSSFLHYQRGELCKEQASQRDGRKTRSRELSQWCKICEFGHFSTTLRKELLI